MKVFLSILGMLILLFIGLICGGALRDGITEFIAARDPQAWTSAQGVLSRVMVMPSGAKFVVHAEYSYIVDGTRYQRDIYELKQTLYPTADDARREAVQTLGLNRVKWEPSREEGAQQARLSAQNTRVNVYYHPAYPRHGALRQFPSGSGDEVDVPQLVAISILSVVTLLCTAGFVFCARNLLPARFRSKAV